MSENSRKPLPRGTHTGPSVQAKPLANSSSFAPAEISLSKRGSSRSSENLSGGGFGFSSARRPRRQSGRTDSRQHSRRVLMGSHRSGEGPSRLRQELLAELAVVDHVVLDDED